MAIMEHTGLVSGRNGLDKDITSSNEGLDISHSGEILVSVYQNESLKRRFDGDHCAGNEPPLKKHMNGAMGTRGVTQPKCSEGKVDSDTVNGRLLKKQTKQISKYSNCVFSEHAALLVQLGSERKDNLPPLTELNELNLLVDTLTSWSKRLAAKSAVPENLDLLDAALKDLASTLEEVENQSRGGDYPHEEAPNGARTPGVIFTPSKPNGWNEWAAFHKDGGVRYLELQTEEEQFDFVPVDEDPELPIETILNTAKNIANGWTAALHIALPESCRYLMRPYVAAILEEANEVEDPKADLIRGLYVDMMTEAPQPQSLPPFKSKAEMMWCGGEVPRPKKKVRFVEYDAAVETKPYLYRRDQSVPEYNERRKWTLDRAKYWNDRDATEDEKKRIKDIVNRIVRGSIPINEPQVWQASDCFKWKCLLENFQKAVGIKDWTEIPLPRNNGTVITKG